MSKNILFVDDDANILAAYQRKLRKEFQLELALGPEEGLEALERAGSFAVVVTDMSMPGMNGIEFLKVVQERAPDCVRIMLTGHADLQTAMNAVNQGNIFRFLTKPCSSEALSAALQDGLRQHQLIIAEKELLEKTLRGSVRVLTETLSMVNPIAFSRSTRIWRYVRHITVQFELQNQWSYDLAALLSQIGCITLPHEVLDRIYAQRPVTTQEQEMFQTHPAVGCKLLINIPRLQPVARMIENQLKAFSDHPSLDELSEEERGVVLGAQILKVAHDFDQLVSSGEDHRSAMNQLLSQGEVYNPDIVRALKNYRIRGQDKKVMTVRLNDLSIGMIVDEDIRTETGLLLIPSGQEVTYSVLVRLKNFSREVGVVEPFRVRVDTRIDEEDYPQNQIISEQITDI